jgi:hypothetical protein
MILLEHPETGDRCLVESMDGYAGWAVVDLNVPPPPGDHYRWVEHERRWRADPGRRLRAENLAGIRDPEVLLAIIEDLLARVAALETKEN